MNEICWTLKRNIRPGAHSNVFLDTMRMLPKLSIYAFSAYQGVSPRKSLKSAFSDIYLQIDKTTCDQIFNNKDSHRLWTLPNASTVCILQLDENVFHGLDFGLVMEPGPYSPRLCSNVCIKLNDTLTLQCDLGCRPL